MGCTAYTLLEWFKRHEIDSGSREGVTTEERERIKALEQALYVRQPGREGALIHHCRPGLARRIQPGVEPSVGSRGDSYDNALAETINGLYKAELIHRRVPWKTREALELAALE